MTYRFCAADRWSRTEEIGSVTPAPPAPPLDFNRPFMPDALARTAALGFLSPVERLRLNQIRGNAYLVIAGLLDDLGLRPLAASARADALGAFRLAFAARFGSRCETIDAEAVAEALAVEAAQAQPLLEQHGVWMARRHVQAAALNKRTLEPGFGRLFLNRWLDAKSPVGEARPDNVRTAPPGPSAAEAAVEGYRRLLDRLGEVLQAQALLDLAALERVCRPALSAQEREQTLTVQHHAYWWTFIGCGLTHPRFAEAVQRLQPGALAEFDVFAATLPERGG